MTGIERIAKERARQMEKEGWDEDHDDEHVDSSLAWAAVCYAAPGRIYMKETHASGDSYIDPWPYSWDAYDDKRPRSGNVLKDPSDKQYLRQLEKAGALIAAEIDRLLRKRKK